MRPNAIFAGLSSLLFLCAIEKKRSPPLSPPLSAVMGVKHLKGQEKKKKKKKREEESGRRRRKGIHPSIPTKNSLEFLFLLLFPHAKAKLLLLLFSCRREGKHVSGSAGERKRKRGRPYAYRHAVKEVGGDSTTSTALSRNSFGPLAAHAGEFHSRFGPVCVNTL